MQIIVCQKLFFITVLGKKGILRREGVLEVIKGVGRFKMTVDRDLNLYRQAKGTVESLMRHYRHGAYRVIRNPEGAVSLWAIESNPNEPFSISFADKGRVYYKIEDVPHDMLKSFLEYFCRTQPKRG
jgi:hypothetical protein